MAYTIVPEVAEGDSWTAKDMNKYVKDNFAAGVPDIFTTKGDIAVATGGDAATRLEVGTDDQMLVADSNESTGIKWIPRQIEDIITTKGDILAATSANTLVRRGIASGNSRLIADSTEDAGVKFESMTKGRLYSSDQKLYLTGSYCQFTSEGSDAAGTLNTSSNNLFTCPTGRDGFYLVSLNVFLNDYSRNAWDVNTYIRFSIYVDGVRYGVFAGRYSQVDRVGENWSNTCTGYDIIQLAAGENLQIYCEHDAGTLPTHYQQPNFINFSIAFLQFAS
jgi:hypothetical protein